MTISAVEPPALVLPMNSAQPVTRDRPISHVTADR
jgi:hypothetical protein